MSLRPARYRQCRLLRPVEGGRQVRVLWIPEVFAVEGDTIRLKGPGGRWVDGWLVESAGPPVDAATVERNSRDHRHQRAASDVVFAEVRRENVRAMRADDR